MTPETWEGKAQELAPILLTNAAKARTESIKLDGVKYADQLATELLGHADTLEKYYKDVKNALQNKVDEKALKALVERIIKANEFGEKAQARISSLPNLTQPDSKSKCLKLGPSWIDLFNGSTSWHQLTIWGCLDIMGWKQPFKLVSPTRPLNFHRAGSSYSAFEATCKAKEKERWWWQRTGQGQQAKESESHLMPESFRHCPAIFMWDVFGICRKQQSWVTIIIAGDPVWWQFVGDTTGFLERQARLTWIETFVTSLYFWKPFWHILTNYTCQPKAVEVLSEKLSSSADGWKRICSHCSKAWCDYRMQTNPNPRSPSFDSSVHGWFLACPCMPFVLHLLLPLSAARVSNLPFDLKDKLAKGTQICSAIRPVVFPSNLFKENSKFQTGWWQIWIW